MAPNGLKSSRGTVYLLLVKNSMQLAEIKNCFSCPKVEEI